MTQYMFSVIHGDLDYSPDEMQSIVADVEAFNDKYATQTVFAGGLEPPSISTVVDGTGNDVVVTDGPFVETKEQLGGFYLLECNSLDEAIEWAAKIPGAQFGSVEVRPVMNYEGSGAEGAQQSAAAHS